MSMQDMEPEAAAEHLNVGSLLYCVAPAMEERAVLHRLFSEQLAAHHFREAQSIVWTVTTKTLDADTVSADVVSSGYWLDTLRDTESYSFNAHADD